MTIEQINRYSRQLMADKVGLEGQMKIRAAKILVIGAGGLGCPVLQYLAGAGIGTIGIVDFDTIAIHNLHRQVLYTTADIGKKKVAVAAERLQAINPDCNLLGFDMKLEEEQANDLIGQFDLVIDGSDNFRTRYLVNDACKALGKPLVYGSILNFEGQVAVFNYKGSNSLRHLFPEPPDPGDVPGCSENGVLGIVPGMIGTMMCDIALKIVLENEVPVNTLLIADFDRYQFQKISY